MIDIWLLFNLVLPFAEVTFMIDNGSCLTRLSQVLLQTYIEHLRGLVEESKTINHHGKEIQVDNKINPETQMKIVDVEE